MDDRHSSAPPPSTTFDARWSPSRSIPALDPAKLTLTKREPRLWERAPHKPTSQDSRFKVVWKRFEFRQTLRSAQSIPPLHSTPILDDSIIGRGAPKSPERAVKRLRVASVSFSQTKELDGEANYIPTKWERRRSISSLPSKPDRCIYLAHFKC